jgi:flagellar hook assembly protein FlgD
MPGADLRQIGVLVINPKRTGTEASYTLVLENNAVSTSVADGVPADFALRQNEPNPFNPSTTISFSLPDRAPAGLLVYDPAGRLVRTLVRDEPLSAGAHRFVWDGRDDRGAEAASGVYLYRLESGSRSETRKMVLIR